MDAGMVKGAIRSAVGAASLFSLTLTSDHSKGDALLSAPDVGDIQLIQLRDNPLLVSKGAFLASDMTVEITTATQVNNSFGAITSDLGFFMLRASGEGTLALSANGTILAYELERNEVRAVDNGHIVAWTDAMNYSVRLSGGSKHAGIMPSVYSSQLSGEGLTRLFTGPGTLWVQTHKNKIVDGQLLQRFMPLIKHFNSTTR